MLTRRKKILSKLPIVLLLLGTGLTIVSALISHVWISDNSIMIEAHQRTINSLNEHIEQKWQRKLVLDQKEDTLSLFEGMAAQQITQSNEYHFVVKEYLQQILKFTGSSDSQALQDIITSAKYFDDLPLRSVHEFFQNLRTEWIEDINTTYGELLEHRTLIEALENENQRYSDAALFFQLFGLILVLASRHQHAHSGHFEE